MESNEETKPVSAVTLPRTSIPAVYVNGFTVGFTLSEINVIMLLNDQPFQLVNMSFSTAKTLMEYLKNSLDNYEAKTHQKVLSMEEVREFLVLNPSEEHKS